MNCSFSQPVRVALLSAAFVGLTATAASAAPVQSGVLQCNVASGAGFIIGSSKSLSCVFHRRGRPEFYAGTINRVGLDIGVTGPGQVTWYVISEGPPGRHYALAGDYAGPGLGIALGGGGSANSLVGGYANSISLQPVSGATTGLNLSAGIGALTLQPVAAGPPGRRWHHG
ncbi:MAG TPA: DUF992 domain-containing protein [Methylocella sp.]|nr:DUF992 domain-containing protein [Methylocella sp.]